MPGRPDPAGAVAHASARPGVAPGQVGLAVVGTAAALAVLVAMSGSGQDYWLCVPAAVAGAAWCRTRRTRALATAAMLAGAGVPALALTRDPPTLWVALLAPIVSVVILDVTRTRIERERDDLRDFALADPLTGVANRRALLTHAAHEVARHRRAQRRFAVVMLDLDGFKAINDRFGHAAGDDLLREVGAALTRAMRAQDMVARIGGDEFCVLAPETDGPGADQLAERDADAVAGATGATAGAHRVGGSVGAAVYPDDAQDPAALIAIADERLLEAKRTLYRSRPRRRAA